MLEWSCVYDTTSRPISVINCLFCVSGKKACVFRKKVRTSLPNTTLSVPVVVSCIFTQNVERIINVKLYVYVYVGPYLQCVLRKKTDKTVVCFPGIQGDYVFCYVLRFASQMLKVSINWEFTRERQENQKCKMDQLSHRIYSEGVRQR